MLKRFTPWAIVLMLAILFGLCIAAPDLLHHALSVALAPGGGALLAWGPVVLGLQRQHAEAIKAMKELNAKADREGRDFTGAEQSQFDKLGADAASLKTRIERAQQLEADSAAVVGDAGAVTFRSFTSLKTFENGDANPTRGFAHQGDFLKAVANAPVVRKNGGAIDQRLAPLAAAPSTGANEGSGSDGGFLAPPAFAREIFTLGLSEDSLLPYTSEIQLDGNSIVLPKDESTPWGTTGPRVAWAAEMTQATPTKPALGGMDLRLKKLMGVVPITNELWADAIALGQWLPEKLGLSVRWRSNEAVLFGSGAGTPIGAYNTSAIGAVVTVPKDTGQASGTLSVTNLATMIARLPPGSYGRSVWMINNDVIPALLTLTLGNWPVFVPLGGSQGPIQAAPSWLLLGRPVIISQHANTFSSQGDVMLMDLSYYQTISKAGGVQFATSMHLYFDADAMAFRVTFRLDGQPKISAPITPAKGNNKMSPFVQLGAR